MSPAGGWAFSGWDGVGLGRQGDPAEQTALTVKEWQDVNRAQRGRPLSFGGQRCGVLCLFRSFVLPQMKYGPSCWRLR